MRSILLSLLMPMIALSACSQPFEGRVAAKLHAAGIPEPIAQCMAKRWVDRLNVLQLRKIEQLSGAVGERHKDGSLTVIGFISEVRRMDDPEIVTVVTASAGICALGL